MRNYNGIKASLMVQKIKQHPFITVGIFVVVLAIIAFILAIHNFGWDWTGFIGGVSKTTVTSTPQGKATSTEMQPAKSLSHCPRFLPPLSLPPSYLPSPPA